MWSCLRLLLLRLHFLHLPLLRFPHLVNVDALDDVDDAVPVVGDFRRRGVAAHGVTVAVVVGLEPEVGVAVDLELRQSLEFICA